MTSWLHLAVTVLMSLVSGFLGGWIVAFRMGSWRQSVEDRLEVHEKRLEKGNPQVDAVPLLQERTKVILEDVKEIKRDVREMRAEVVTHGECDRRHGNEKR